MRLGLLTPNNPAAGPTPNPLIITNTRAHVSRLPRVVRSRTSGQMPVPPVIHTTAFIPGNFRGRVHRLPPVVRSKTSGQVPFPKIVVSGPLIPVNSRPRVQPLPALRRPTARGPLPLPTSPGPLVPAPARRKALPLLRLVRGRSSTPVPPPVVTTPTFLPPNVRARVKPLLPIRRAVSGLAPVPAQAVPLPNVRARVQRLLPRRLVPSQPVPPAPAAASTFIPANVRARVRPLPPIRRSSSGRQPVPAPVVTSATFPANVRPRVQALLAVKRGRSPQGPFSAVVPNPLLVPAPARRRVLPTPRTVRRPNTSGQVPLAGQNQLLASPGMAYPASVYPAGGSQVIAAAPFSSVVWSRRTPATTPTARFVFGMCTDQNGDIIVLGGDITGSGVLGDMWKYTEPGGSPTWTQLTPAATPWSLLGGGTTGIRDCQMRLDPISGNVVAFSGDTNITTSVQNTWTWNGTTWANATTPGGMEGRAEYAITNDPVTGRVMVQGGWPTTGGSPMVNDHWTWTGTTWTQFTGALPPVRAGHSMALDPGRGIVVLFGGHTDTAYTAMLGDTWTWNGTKWAQVFPTLSPAPRSWHMMWYDPGLAMVLLYSGFTAAVQLNDLWGFNGSNWVPIAQDRVSEIPGGGQVIYSSKLSKAIAFGGSVGTNSAIATSETWQVGSVALQDGIRAVQYAPAVGVGTTSLPFIVGPTK